jgi:FixJ family two-component response regulator
VLCTNLNIAGRGTATLDLFLWLARYLLLEPVLSPLSEPVRTMTIEEVDAKILVIDDNHGPRQSMRFLMKAWQVDLAENGLIGLEKIGGTQYGAVVLDLRMPEMPGIEVLREIQTVDPDVAVIMWTAFADIASAAEAVRLGADDHQCKPFQAPVMRQALLAAVERCRERRRKRVLLSEARDDQDGLMQELLQKGQKHDRMVDTAAGVCHDVNNQLQTAVAIVETISMSEEDFDTSQQLRLAHNSLQRCTEIVSELMKDPQPQAKPEAIEFTELTQLVEDVLQAVSLDKIELRLDLPPFRSRVTT